MSWLNSILSNIQDHPSTSDTNHIEDYQQLNLNGSQNNQTPLFTPTFINDSPTETEAQIAINHLVARASVNGANTIQQSVQIDNRQEIKSKPSYIKVFPLPAGYESSAEHKGKDASRWNLTLAVVTDALKENGINPTRAEVEEIARMIEEDKGLQFSDNKPAKADFYDLPDGRRVWGYQLRIDESFQEEVIGKYESLSPETKGKLGLTEMGMKARMQAAIEIAYDKHLTPEVKQSLGNISKEQIAGAMLVGGAVGIVSKTAGKSALGPLGVGAAIYGGIKTWQSAQTFIDLCGNAKTQKDLDEAAKYFAKTAGEMAADGALGLVTAGSGMLAPKVTRAADEAFISAYKGLRESAESLKMPEPVLVTPDGLTMPIVGKPQADELNIKSKSEDLGMLKDGSKAGREKITETAEDGLSENAQASTKKLKNEISKEGIKQAKEQLVTLNVGRTELMARLDTLASNSKFSSQVQISARKARNSLQDHLTQDDLMGALRDVKGMPVRRSGDGYTYDHYDEVRTCVASLERTKKNIVREMNQFQPGTGAYKELSKEADALSEMIRRIEKFLEIK